MGFYEEVQEKPFFSLQNKIVKDKIAEALCVAHKPCHAFNSVHDQSCVQKGDQNAVCHHATPMEIWGFPEILG